MQDESAYRQEKIKELLEQEIKEGEDLTLIAKKNALDILTRDKGYLNSDIEFDVKIETTLDNETEISNVDFVISMDNIKLAVIKCVAGSLVSRERHVVAAARLLDELPVPLAVVIDTQSASVLNAMTGKTIGEGFESIPARAELHEIASKIEISPIPPGQLEKEKRILRAYDSVKCIIPQGGDGGVTIGEPEEEKS